MSCTNRKEIDTVDKYRHTMTKNEARPATEAPHSFLNYAEELIPISRDAEDTASVPTTVFDHEQR